MDELKTKPRVVGLKQSRKSVKDGRAVLAFVADDAEPRVIQPFVDLCAGHGVPVERVKSCEELGRACGIEVGAAVAVILN